MSLIEGLVDITNTIVHGGLFIYCTWGLCRIAKYCIENDV